MPREIEVLGVKITAVKKEVVALSNDLGHIATLLVAGSDQYSSIAKGPECGLYLLGSG